MWQELKLKSASLSSLNSDIFFISNVIRTVLSLKSRYAGWLIQFYLYSKESTKINFGASSFKGSLYICKGRCLTFSLLNAIAQFSCVFKGKSSFVVHSTYVLALCSLRNYWVLGFSGIYVLECGYILSMVKKNELCAIVTHLGKEYKMYKHCCQLDLYTEVNFVIHCDVTSTLKKNPGRWCHIYTTVLLRFSLWLIEIYTTLLAFCSNFDQHYLFNELVK